MTNVLLLDGEQLQAQAYALVDGSGGAIIRAHGPDQRITLELPTARDIRGLIEDLQTALVQSLNDQAARQLRGLGGEPLCRYCRRPERLHHIGREHRYAPPLTAA
jgi:hypothetical protein